MGPHAIRVKGLALFLLLFLALLLITFLFVLINVGFDEKFSVKRFQLDENFTYSCFIITLVFGYMMFLGGGQLACLHEYPCKRRSCCSWAIILLGFRMAFTFAGGDG
jgi:hypothetical protein